MKKRRRPTGLVRNPDGVYWCRLYTGGRGSTRKQFTFGKVDKETAVNLYDEKKKELRALRGAAPASFAACAAAYLSAKERGLSERSAVERFRPAFGDKLAKDLRIADWWAYQGKREREDKISNATAKREFSIFRAILNHAAVGGIITHNPIPKGAAKFDKSSARIDFFTREEWAAFTSAFDDEARFRARVEKVRKFGPKSGAGRRGDSKSTGERLADLRETVPVFRALLLTASRLSEITGLTWADVNLGAGTIRIPQSKTGEAKHVPINPELRTLLQSLQKGTGAAIVFRRRDGAAFERKEIQRAFDVAKKLSGIRAELTTHSLRHTAASWMVQAGIPIFDVSKALGHASVQVTAKHYAHLAPDHLRDAFRALSAAVDVR